MFYNQWKEIIIIIIIILFLSLATILKIVKLPDLWKCSLYNMFDTWRE